MGSEWLALTLHKLEVEHRTHRARHNWQVREAKARQRQEKAEKGLKKLVSSKSK